MSDPVYVYVGTYESEDAAKADLDVVRGLFAQYALRTYDAAVVVRDSDGKVHVRRHDGSAAHPVVDGAAVGLLVGLLFPPVLLATTALGAAAGAFVEHLWHGLSRRDLKDLGEFLDEGEASLVVISTTGFDHAFNAALKAEKHEIKKLDKADAKEFEHDLEALAKS